MDIRNYRGSNGWLEPQKWAGPERVVEFKCYAQEIRQSADVFILVGVGGSNQAARAVIEGLDVKGGPQIIYTGNNLSAVEMEKILRRLEGKSVYLNVIAKNFETLEPGVAFRILRTWMKKTYGDACANRIFATGTAGSSLERLCREKNVSFPGISG